MRRGDVFSNGKLWRHRAATSLRYRKELEELINAHSVELDHDQ